MTENDSIKITKAEKLPDSYYGSSFEENDTKEYVRHAPRDKKLLIEKAGEDSFDNKIRKYFDKFKKSSRAGIKKLTEAVYSAAQTAGASAKEIFAPLYSAAKSRIKKVSLEAGVSAGMLLVTVIFTACFCSVSYSVSLGGADIGIISEKSDFNNLIAEINDEISPYGEVNFTLQDKPRFTPKLILKGDLTDRDEIKERIKSTSPDMIPAYGIVVDNIPVFAMASEDMAKEVLTEYTQKFLEGTENAEMSFLNDVTISHIFVPKTMLKTKESALSMLDSGKHIHYTAQEGDSLESVASKNGVTVESIMLSNTVADIENLAGQELDIYTDEPIIGIKVTSRVNEVEAIACSTVTENDNTKYIGTVDVKNEGKDGEKQVEALVTMINGVVTEKDIISEKILSEPVNRVEIIGTKEKPSPYGTGDFATPTSGQLSSRFGSRWGKQHKGIDLAANEGTPIYAADNGTVIYSQYNDGGFGYLIEIDHANGYVTYYAHCSKLVAKEGDVVAKGDLIGYVGNTGRSTGAHLHFEVRKNGEPCDPMEFIEE